MHHPRAVAVFAVCTTLAQACSVFEVPISQGSDASYDGEVLDGDVSDGGSDADMLPDGGRIPIPPRPALTSCGFGAPQTLGTVTNATLDEVSGMAASRKNARVFWLIEDSGGAAAVYAVNDLGVTIAIYQVGGAALDYEDIAIGPGPEVGVDYLYIADIGDNSGGRATRTVYRAREPSVTWNQAATTGSLVGTEPLPFTFPGVYREDNAESIFVDPSNQDIYIVTKNGFSRPNTVFVLPAPHQATVAREMTYVGGVFAGSGIDIAVTSADIAADGSRIVMRSINSVNHWTRSPGATIADTILTTLPCEGSVGSAETKGESVTLGTNGYYTFSEGTAEPISFIPFVP